MLFFLTESQDDTDTPMEAQNMNDSGVDETIVDTTRPSQRQVPTVSRTPDLQQFRSEASRLETFRSWTHRYPMPADLANAGFIFTGKFIVNPKEPGLFGEMKFVLSNFLSNEDLSISYES